MANTFTLISTTTLTGSQASIDLTSIPQTYTDLVLKYGARGSGSGVGSIFVSFNSSTTGFTGRYLQGSGSSAGSSTYNRFAGAVNGSGETSDTFTNIEMYIPNYAGSTNKSYSVDSVHEKNATESYQTLIAGLWSNTDAITSISLTIDGGTSFVAGSTASLYGILKGSGGATVS